jgi:hypothetical protein
MIKKLFISLLLLNSIIAYIVFATLNPTLEVDKNKFNQIVDIKFTSGLIRKYSNLVMEIVPANE